MCFLTLWDKMHTDLRIKHRRQVFQEWNCKCIIDTTKHMEGEQWPCLLIAAVSHVCLSLCPLIISQIPQDSLTLTHGCCWLSSFMTVGFSGQCYFNINGQFVKQALRLLIFKPWIAIVQAWSHTFHTLHLYYMVGFKLQIVTSQAWSYSFYN